MECECGYCSSNRGNENYSVKGKKYPVRFDYKSHYEYQNLGDWKEVHWCPKCKKEFTIEVSSY